MGRSATLLATLCATLLCAGGCGGPTPYRIKTNVPWPDEWALGRREPYHRKLPVSDATVRWHRDLDAAALADALERRLADKRSVFAFVRADFARRRSDLAKLDPRALRYVEARVIPVWLLAGETSGAAPAAEEAESLGQAVERLAASLGRSVAWPEGVDVGTSVHVQPAADPRHALLRTLLQHDLFIRCETPPPRVFRSLEYRSQSEFLKAIDRFVAAASSRAQDRPIEVLPLADWALDYVNRVCGGVEAAPFDLPGKHLGLLSGDDLTDDRLARIRRQLEATLPYHVR